MSEWLWAAGAGVTAFGRCTFLAFNFLSDMPALIAKNIFCEASARDLLHLNSTRAARTNEPVVTFSYRHYRKLRPSPPRLALHVAWHRKNRVENDFTERWIAKNLTYFTWAGSCWRDGLHPQGNDASDCLVFLFLMIFYRILWF